MKHLLTCIFAAFLLAGCSGDDDERTEPGQPPRYMIYSPNGEPLNGGPLGRVTCEKAVGGWFERMKSGDVISEEAFLTDAKAQFARMDIDHNGFIVSEELDRFRAPYRQEALPEKKEDREKHKNRPARSDPSLSMSDPVMSADTNLDFKVTQEEFTHAAREVFARLNAGHDGKLTRADTLTWCEEKKSGGKN